VNGRPVCITGVGLVSSLGDGVVAHWEALTSAAPQPVVRPFIEPFHVHPVVALDFSRQLPNPGEVRRMGQTQRIGAYAAGAAIDDAGLKGDRDRLADAKIVVASTGGERDIELDEAIMADATTFAADRVALTEKLTADLRPSLFLAELPNLLAGHISIIHRMTGGTRTLMGSESAGYMAVAQAVALIADGSAEIVLVGGAANAERPDTMLLTAMDDALWRGSPVPVWQRGEPGGIVFGSLSAFLVLESETAARARAVRPYCRISDLLLGSASRESGSVRDRIAAWFGNGTADRDGICVLSGATGVLGATGEERDALNSIARTIGPVSVRATATMLGHAIEAAFPTNLAVAAIAIRHGAFYPPFSDNEQPWNGATPLSRVHVTGFDRWHGDAYAVVEAV
jgi:3-oxoacyl-[acyl-carrier-protein] synthase II